MQSWVSAGTSGDTQPRCLCSLLPKSGLEQNPQLSTGPGNGRGFGPWTLDCIPGILGSPGLQEAGLGLQPENAAGSGNEYHSRENFYSASGLLSGPLIQVLAGTAIGQHLEETGLAWKSPFSCSRIVNDTVQIRAQG